VSGGYSSVLPGCHPCRKISNIHESPATHNPKIVCVDATLLFLTRFLDYSSVCKRKLSVFPMEDVIVIERMIEKVQDV
jgi:hypothetical protein